jgi:nucleoside-diphosphate-sugar epimerase
MPKSASNRGLVLVTGGSGYVAGYLYRSAPERQPERPRDRAERRQDRGGAHERRQHRVEGSGNRVRRSRSPVRCRLGRSGRWRAQYVWHAASPAPVTDPKDDDELVRPARDAPRLFGGAMIFSLAAKRLGRPRYVMTSFERKPFRRDKPPPR